MISIATCTLALLLSSAVFAAPAVDPAVTASVAVSSFATAPAASVPVVATADAKTTKPVSSSSAPASAPTVPSIDLNPNAPAWDPDTQDPANAQPIRGDLGAPLMGPTDKWTAVQNPDLIAAPSTDHGSV